MTRWLLVLCVVVAGAVSAMAQTGEKLAPAPNGIEVPEGYRDWRVVAVSHRTDNHSLRVILGNDVAIAAAQAGQTNPWPDGAILGKIVWKDATDALWPAAQVPGELLHTEFMIKDSERFAATQGWGFARWRGPEQIPYGQDASFVQECIGCHTPAKDNDYVFTHPARWPKLP